MQAYDTDVVVVGAGPVGLLLAGDLAAAGVSCTLLERRTAESNLTRAFTVHARTLELLDIRGVADGLLATGNTIPTLALFGGIELRLSGIQSRYPYMLITPQYETERVLEARAYRAGADIRRGAEVVGLEQDAEGVTVQIKDRPPLRAAYVVGTDGAKSAVRESLGVEFIGKLAVGSVLLADVRLTEEPGDLLVVNGVAEGFAFIAPFGDGWYRVIARQANDDRPDTEPVDFEELKALTRKALGSDYGMHDPRWTSRFHSDERQAQRYRVGRVFLAGDAAHVHSPALGQGMNTGLQDAANLSWKLAAVVHGRAPEGLLDTYEAERHPIGGRVIKASGLLLRLAMLRSRPLIVVRNVLGRMFARVGPTHRMAGIVTGVGLHYDAPPGAHRLVGQRAPDIELAGEPGRLYGALRAGRFVLVTMADVENTDVVVVRPADPAMPSILVRPDAYIGWATDEPVLDASFMKKWIAS